jgi:hypothetical protein
MTDNLTHQRATAGGQCVKAQDQGVSPHLVKSSGVTVTMQLNGLEEE